MTTRELPQGLRHAMALWHEIFWGKPEDAGKPPTMEPSSRILLAQTLVDVARIDTVYADLYLERARELLAAELDEPTYESLRRERVEAANLPNRIRNALDGEHWEDVRALSTRLAQLNRTLGETQDLRAAARQVYEFPTELVDPFSPGLSGLAGEVDADLPGLLDQAMHQLTTLGEWTRLTASCTPSGAPPSPA